MKRPLALITGGTSGIGLGIALKLASQYDLALSYAVDDEKAIQAKQEVQSVCPMSDVKIFKQLLLGRAECEILYKNVLNDCGQAPAVLVNSAGRLADGLFLQTDFAKIKSVIDEHLLVTMALSQLAIKSMYKARWGRILNLSSISAHFSKRGQANYAAAKAGIEAFTRTLALEVAHRGITINAIAPGLIETPMTKKFVEKLNESTDSTIRSRIPVGRMGQKEEVGALAAFLCSKDAEYITGAVLVIDGGRSLGDSMS